MQRKFWSEDLDLRYSEVLWRRRGFMLTKDLDDKTISWYRAPVEAFAIAVVVTIFISEDGGFFDNVESPLVGEVTLLCFGSSFGRIGGLCGMD